MTKPNTINAKGACVWCGRKVEAAGDHAHWCPSDQNAELISIEYDGEGRERARFYRSPRRSLHWATRPKSAHSKRPTPNNAAISTR